MAALEGRFNNFYVCTKVFFFDILKIALFCIFHHAGGSTSPEMILDGPRED